MQKKNFTKKKYRQTENLYNSTTLLSLWTLILVKKKWENKIANCNGNGFILKIEREREREMENWINCDYISKKWEKENWNRNRSIKVNEKWH